MVIRWRKKARCSLKNLLSMRSTFQIWSVLPQILPSSRVPSPLWKNRSFSSWLYTILGRLSPLASRRITAPF